MYISVIPIIVDTVEHGFETILASVCCTFIYHIGHNFRKRTRNSWNMRKIREWNILLLILEKSANIS